MTLVDPQLWLGLLPFYVQSEVASLDYDDQKALLEEAAEGNLNQQEVREKVRRVKAGDVITLWVQLPVPEEHTGDYQRAIRMLKLHMGDTIELTEAALATFMDDDWGWMTSFMANTMSYAGGSA